MNEWLHETNQESGNSVKLRLDPLEVNTEVDSEEYVMCVSSPYNSSIKHLRRDSFPSGLVKAQDTNRGSAKKVCKTAAHIFEASNLCRYIEIGHFASCHLKLLYCMCRSIHILYIISPL